MGRYSVKVRVLVKKKHSYSYGESRPIGVHLEGDVGDDGRMREPYTCFHLTDRLFLKTNKSKHRNGSQHRL